MNDFSSEQHPIRILGVFAHPDDEIFCARVATRRTIGQVREQELRLGCQRLGIQHVVCLNYVDGTLKEVDQEELIGHVAEIIRTFRPYVVITFGPDGGYGHPDHIAISAATTAACLRSGDRTQFPEQIAAGLAAHQPARLYQSLFPRSRLLLLERLV